MLDNRETAVLVWLGLFVAWALWKPGVRKAAVAVLRAALAWKIALSVSSMAAYVALVVLVLHRLGLWGLDSLKETIVWFLTAALVMLFDVASVPEDDRCFRKAAFDGLKLSVVLEFVVGLYPLSLPLELLLIPTATILACLLVVAESKDEFKSLRSLLQGVMAVLGLVLLVYAIHRVYTDPGSFAQLATLVEFLLPIVLTVLLLPFLYVLAAWGSYEGLFIRLRFLEADRELRRFIKLRLIWRFGLNFRGLNRWWRLFVRERPGTRAEIVASLRRASWDE